MSEPIPESIPTSQDRRSRRPIKKIRPSNDPTSQQSSQIEALFANPDREITTTAPQPRPAAAPPEIVANVQGSSAGAGSGEFHVYKASRRREYERLRRMDEAVDEEEKDREWRERVEWNRVKDEEKTSKGRNRRAKAKARREEGKKGGGVGSMEVDAAGAGKNDEVKRKLAPAKLGQRSDVGDENAVEVENGVNGEGANGANGIEEGCGITFHDDD